MSNTHNPSFYENRNSSHLAHPHPTGLTHQSAVNISDQSLLFPSITNQATGDQTSAGSSHHISDHHHHPTGDLNFQAHTTQFSSHQFSNQLQPLAQPRSLPQTPTQALTQPSAKSPPVLQPIPETAQRPTLSASQRPALAASQSLPFEVNLGRSRKRSGSSPGYSSGIGPYPHPAASVLDPSTPSTSFDPNTPSTSATPAKRGRRPSKLDMKSKLEKSRQSARECRARKKLRYQYLEELVTAREKAIFSLREELEMYRNWCKEMDEGKIPPDMKSKMEKLEKKLTLPGKEDEGEVEEGVELEEDDRQIGEADIDDDDDDVDSDEEDDSDDYDDDEDDDDTSDKPQTTG